MILEKLQEIFRDIFDDEELVINENLTRDDIEDWDSLSNINLVVAIEEEFNVKITLDEVDQFKDIKSILKIIENKIKK